MKGFIILLALAVACSAMTDAESWSYFKNKYGKMYGTADEGARFTIFQQNLRNAEEHQRGDSSAIYGITKFMDLTPAEFKQFYANLNTTSHANWVKSLPQAQQKIGAAGSVDWVAKKAVASVKDQGQCGSCWAFSAAAALEACAMLGNGGVEVDVSAQQIVDCCRAGGSSGCYGGFPDLSVEWAVNQNIATWGAYGGYHARQGTCKSNVAPYATKSGQCHFKSVARSEAALQSAIQDGPISICVDATPLQYYRGGIISGSSCRDHQVDHAVFLVAYKEGESWTVKNSWSSNWGENGYFRVEAGKDCLDMISESSQALPNY